MDIHPEIGALSGEFRNPIIFKLLRGIDKFSCNVAGRVIVLSNDMKVSLEARPDYKKNNIVVINNFSMPFHGEVLPVDNELLKEQGKFRVIFAGNLGRFQGLEAFIDAMKLLIHCSDIELVLLGEGSALSKLKEQAGEMDNIRFLPHQEVSVARGIIRDADLGIVSLSKEIYKYAYPSKTMTYLDEGCPVLVSVEKKSELVRFVNDNKIGACVEPGSTQSIADVIETLYRQKEEHIRMKKAAKAISDEHFSEHSALLKWSSLVDCLGKEQ
jgi:glycosyltransferase involved in cell wall biosynthesis